MTRLALLSITAAAVTVTIPNLAAAQSATREIVRFADLNLNREPDVRILARRLDGAVDYVCGGRPASAAERGAEADYRACRSATMSAALKTVDAPLLTATVEGRRLIQLAKR